MKSNLDLLWVQYKEKGSIGARDEIILHYAPLVKYVASRLAINLSSMVEVDELISYGIEGLIDAIEKYDHKRNVKFETYAITRIRGSMIDGLRSMDWVPVSLRQKGKELEKAYAQLEAQLERAPTDDEVAQKLGIGLKELSTLFRELAATTIVSLDDFITGEDSSERKKRILDLLTDEKAVDALDLVELAAVKSILAKAIARLPDKEKIVIFLYYYEGLILKKSGPF